MAGLREWAALYLKGVAMGSADAVPGVSGGTIALIVGIYERLIAAVTAVDPARIRRLLAGARPANIPDARAAFHGSTAPSCSSSSRASDRGRRRPQRRRPARNASRRDVRLLLRADRGLCGGAFRRRLARHVASEGGRDRGFSLAFLASGYASTALSSSLLVVFVAGAVAVSAMILLPGVSGSLLLVVLGQYEYMSGTVSRFVDGLAAVALGNGTDALAETLPGRDVPARWGRRRVHDRPRREVRARPCPRRDARVPRQSDRRRASGAHRRGVDPAG